MDDGIYEIAAKYNVPYILMHMRGQLNDMQDHCSYSDLISEVKRELIERVELAQMAGVEKIIIDPGFGFSKTLSQNYELLKNLTILKDLELPLLVGVSRKSMIYKFLECKPEEALNATTVLNTFALLNGADILRVHDVKEASEARLLINKTLG
jgi:dihydropteroate synthase